MFSFSLISYSRLAVSNFSSFISSFVLLLLAPDFRSILLFPFTTIRHDVKVSKQLVYLKLSLLISSALTRDGLAVVEHSCNVWVHHYDVLLLSSLLVPLIDDGVDPGPEWLLHNCVDDVRQVLSRQSLSFPLNTWQTRHNVWLIGRIFQHRLNLQSFKSWNLNVLHFGLIDASSLPSNQVPHVPNGDCIVLGQVHAAVVGAEAEDFRLGLVFTPEGRCINSHQLLVLTTSINWIILLILHFDLINVD